MLIQPLVYLQSCTKTWYSYSAAIMVSLIFTSTIYTASIHRRMSGRSLRRREYRQRLGADSRALWSTQKCIYSVEHGKKT